MDEIFTLRLAYDDLPLNQKTNLDDEGKYFFLGIEEERWTIYELLNNNYVESHFLIHKEDIKSLGGLIRFIIDNKATGFFLDNKILKQKSFNAAKRIAEIRNVDLFYIDEKELKKLLRKSYKRISPSPNLILTPSLSKSYKRINSSLNLTLTPSQPNQTLTPHYLATTVAPYLAALKELQHLSDEIQGNEPSEVKVKSITQNSPLQVTLEGAAKAVEITQKIITPWRREHAIEMAYLKEEQTRERAEAQELAEAQKAEAEAMQAEAEAKKAEVLERRARAAKERAEAKQMAAQAAKIEQEAERMRLENEKLRLELYQAKVQLGLDIITQLNPALAEAERAAYLMRLLPVVDTLLLSDLTMTGSA